MEWRISDNCSVAAVDAGQPVGGVNQAIHARFPVGRTSTGNGLELHVYAVDRKNALLRGSLVQLQPGADNTCAAGKIQHGSFFQR